MNSRKQKFVERNSSLPTFVKVERITFCFLFKQSKCAVVTAEMGEGPDFITNFTFQVNRKFC